MHLVRHHKGGVEAQSEVADDLILIGLVLVLLQEIRSAGEGNLVDVLLYLVCGHSKTRINEFQRLFLGIHHHPNHVLEILGIGVLSDEIQLFQLGNGIAAVGDKLPEENVVVGIEPLFDNRKNIFAVNGKTSMHFSHKCSLLRICFRILTHIVIWRK